MLCSIAQLGTVLLAALCQSVSLLSRCIAANALSSTTALWPDKFQVCTAFPSLAFQPCSHLETFAASKIFEYKRMDWVNGPVS